MSARIRVALRSAASSLVLLAAAVAVVGNGGCGGGDGSGSGRSIIFTPGAMRSVPLVRPAGPTPVRASLAGSGSIDQYGFTRQLLGMQCRRAPPESVDYCPPGTPDRAEYGSGSDPYKFSMQTIIGFIYHAQMYSELVTDCSGSGFEPRTVSAGAYAAASSSAAANPTRFIFDQFDTYTCRSTRVSNQGAETRVVSAVEDRSYQTTLHTRYKYVAGGNPQTDFFQMDVSMNAGTPEFLAFNFASAAPFSSRLVLLVNLTNHRFAVKYYTPPATSESGTTPERFAVAAGVGGWDLASGVPNAGNYFIHFREDQGEFTACVNNVGGGFEATPEPCDLEQVPTSWSVSTMQSYLGVPVATAARIAPYLAVFGDMNTLQATDLWDTALPGDADLYWPARLE